MHIPGRDPEKDLSSQAPESSKVSQKIPGSMSTVEYYNGSFWLRSSPQEWEVAGITSTRARQLLGEDMYSSLIKELAEKNLSLPTKSAEIVTGIQQGIRDLLRWRVDK